MIVTLTLAHCFSSLGLFFSLCTYTYAYTYCYYYCILYFLVQTRRRPQFRLKRLLVSVTQSWHFTYNHTCFHCLSCYLNYKTPVYCLCSRTDWLEPACSWACLAWIIDRLWVGQHLRCLPPVTICNSCALCAVQFLQCLTFVQSLIHLNSALSSKLSSEFQLQEGLLHCSKLNLDLFKMSGEPASQSLCTVCSCVCLQSFAWTLSRACPNWAYSPVHMTQSVLDLFARVCARVCKFLRSLWQASQDCELLICQHCVRTCRSSVLLHYIHDTWYWHNVITRHVVV